MSGAFITAATHTLTCHEKAITGSRNFWVSVFPEGLLELIGTYNIVKQKAAIDHSSRAFSLRGVVRSRIWFVRPQAVATKSHLSNEGRKTGGA